MDGLKINQLLEIVIEGEAFREYYPVRIENIEKDSIMMGMPMKKGGLIRMQVGQEIRCVFRSHNQYFGFTATITEVVISPIPLLITTKPEQITSINQKRAYVRIEVSLPIEYRLSRDKEDDEEAVPSYDRGLTINISAGGVLFCTDIRLESRQLLDIKLHIPSQETFEAKAKVLRIFDKVDARGRYIWAAIQYLEVSDAKRDKLFNYIFEKQRELINTAYKW